MWQFFFGPAQRGIWGMYFVTWLACFAEVMLFGLTTDREGIIHPPYSNLLIGGMLLIALLAFFFLRKQSASITRLRVTNMALGIGAGILATAAHLGARIADGDLGWMVIVSVLVALMMWITARRWEEALLSKEG